MKAIAATLLVSLSSSVLAQSTVYVNDFRNGGRWLETDTASYVANLVQIGPNPAPSIFALDYDETGSTIWAVTNDTFEYGSIDPATGTWTSLGFIIGIIGATGLTCATDGTWYLSEYDSGSGGTNLYVGDVTTGTFTLVGVMGLGIVIDIAIDSQGNMYGHNISDDTLYSIDTTTAAATAIGATGHAANFAQGMDFDWSNDKLYASIYTGGGTGVFAEFDLVTGAGVVIEDTTPTNAEMEITIKSSISGVGTNYCTSTLNSTGFASTISGAGSNSIAADNLTISADNLPQQPGIFIAGPGQTQAPFFNGFLCVSPQGLQRFATVNLPTNGVVTEAVSIATSVPGGLNVAAGQPYYFQRWNRDPGGGGASANFSDGLQVDYVP